LQTQKEYSTLNWQELNIPSGSWVVPAYLGGTLLTCKKNPDLFSERWRGRGRGGVRMQAKKNVEN
jgi:hypothetical protein